MVLADRDEGSARETAETIGEAATVVAADVSREDDCRGLVAACLERHGRVDVLHHNVGIGAGDGWTEDLDIEAWERIMRVNAGSAAMLAKAVVPPMRDQGAGAITNVSSIAAVCATITRLGNPPLGYKMSKAALNALTQSLAQTYAGDGIRVNAIMPGLIDTPMGVDAAARDVRARPRPLRRRARRDGAAQGRDGQRLGRRQRRGLPRLRRGALRDRRPAAGRRGAIHPDRMRLSPAHTHGAARARARDGERARPAAARVTSACRRACTS